MKNKICNILIGISLISFLCCIVVSLINTFKNIDKTELELFVEYPLPTIIAVVAGIILIFAVYMRDDKNNK